MGETGSWRQHAAVAAIYAALAWGIIDHGVSLTENIAGKGSDPFAFIWFMAWWPYALGHQMNPFFTHLVWQPVGVALSWVTGVPLLALLAAPLTLSYGPVLSYNLWIILAPALAAWSAYRLCGHLTRDRVPAFMGGLLFGFSSYEMAQDNAALNLSFTAFLPALLWVVLLRLQDEITRGKAVAWAALLLVLQFLMSIEISALMFIFGGAAWLLAWRLMPERRALLARLVIDGLWAGLVVVAALSPLLWQMLVHFHMVNLPAIWPYYFAADLLNLVLPGQAGLLPLLPAQATGGGQEQDAYLGLPLLGIVALFIWREWKVPSGRLLSLMFLLLLLASFGPVLWVGGHPTRIILPWIGFVHLPLLGSALPARFALFVSLATAMMAALWLAAPATRGVKWRRWALAGLACVALLPAPHAWVSVPDARFFAPGEVQAVLGPAPRLLILPFALNGPSAYWQVENRFGFSQTGGYLGFPPRAMQRFKAIFELAGHDEQAEMLPDFVAFCAQTGTQFVVAGPGTPPGLLRLLASLHWPQRQVDDVVILTVPGNAHG